MISFSNSVSGQSSRSWWKITNSQMGLQDYFFGSDENRTDPEEQMVSSQPAQSGDINSIDSVSNPGFFKLWCSRINGIPGPCEHSQKKNSKLPSVKCLFFLGAAVLASISCLRLYSIHRRRLCLRCFKGDEQQEEQQWTSLKAKSDVRTFPKDWKQCGPKVVYNLIKEMGTIDKDLFEVYAKFLRDQRKKNGSILKDIAEGRFTWPEEIQGKGESLPFKEEHIGRITRHVGKFVEGKAIGNDPNEVCDLIKQFGSRRLSVNGRSHVALFKTYATLLRHRTYENKFVLEDIAGREMWLANNFHERFGAEPGAEPRHAGRITRLVRKWVEEGKIGDDPDEVYGLIKGMGDMVDKTHFENYAKLLQEDARENPVILEDILEGGATFISEYFKAIHGVDVHPMHQEKIIRHLRKVRTYLTE